jgi:uncharacterized protein (DUF1697 family)
VHTYIVLIRGINVGGKNSVSMTSLKSHLETEGFSNVKTYINSGNVILNTNQKPASIKSAIEALLPKKFTLDRDIIKVHVISDSELKAVIDSKPKGFGNDPEKYYSDVIFLIGVTADEAMGAFNPREGVDKVWPGDGVIYSQRLGAERTKSRLNKITASPYYQSMTIRSWSTTIKLLELVDKQA